MNLKQIFTVLFLLIASNINGACFSQQYKLFASEIYFDGDKWFLEFNNSPNDFMNEPTLIDSIQISCKQGTSYVKAFTLDTVRAKCENMYVTAEDLESELQFDRSSDSIVIKAYQDGDLLINETIEYGDKTTDMCKAPAEGQSICLWGSMCTAKAAISETPTIGAKNVVITLGSSQMSNEDIMLITNDVVANTLRVNLNLYTDIQNAILAIHSFSGDKLFTGYLEEKQQLIEISTEILISGMYILTLTTDQGTVASEFIYIP